jgi:hypothetical protein
MREADGEGSGDLDAVSDEDFEQEIAERCEELSMCPENSLRDEMSDLLQVNPLIPLSPKRIYDNYIKEKTENLNLQINEKYKN